MPDKTQENPRAETDQLDDDEVQNEDVVETDAGGAISSIGLGRRRTNQPLPPFSRSTAGSPINADRPVFTLSVAADLLGMHPRTLRIYEEEGLVVPARTPTKRRRYSQNDIKRFQFIQHLTQRLKVNLAGVRIILEMMTALESCGVDFMPRLYEMGEQAAGENNNTPH